MANIDDITVRELLAFIRERKVRVHAEPMGATSYVIAHDTAKGEWHWEVSSFEAAVALLAVHARDAQTPAAPPTPAQPARKARKRARG